MKLWKLRPRFDLPNNESPWMENHLFGYDTAQGFIIRAETEGRARQMAQERGGEENENADAWLDSKYSTCEELLPEGKSEIILSDICNA